MTFTIHRSFAALALAAVLGFIAFFDAGTARAQCNPLTITNNTTCPILLNLFAPSGVTMAVTVPPGGPLVYPFPPSFSAIGFITPSGNVLLFPPVGGPCTPCIAFTSSAATCCATVCQPAPCTLVINPVIPCNTTCL